jgi:xanthine dehydrogenase molybdenum-binding subunit
MTVVMPEKKTKFKYVGERIIRPDARDKARGKTRYTGDIRRHGMLYAKLVTSRKAHAKVTIYKDGALEIEGVKAVFTYDDVPHHPYNSNQWFSGAVSDEDEYILHEVAKHVGDRIALVVGESPEAVDRGLKAVKVEYEELPVVIGIDEAKKDETIIFKDTNRCFHKTLSCGDVDRGFEEADYIIEDEGGTPKIHHAAMENHVCLAEVDEFGSVVVWSPCQVVFQVQHVIAKALEIPYDKIRVIKAIIGGSFGGKGMPVLEPVTAFAALKMNRPVQILMERRDSVGGTRMRNQSKQKVKTGITKDGKIVAREIEMELDGGAYITNSAAIAMAAGKKAFRTYDIDNQKYSGSTYFTNTTPGGACRGYGSPQIHAITEINLNNAANKIGMDPVEFRIKNAFDPREFEEGAVDQIGMPGIGNARIKDCLIEGAEAFNWKERKEKIKEKNTERYAYGLGLAAAAHGNGYHGGFPDYTNVDIQMMPDCRVMVKVGIHDLGCGTVLTMQQIAAEVLDIDPLCINVPQADTHISPYDSAGTQASRVTFVCGGAVKEGADLLKDKMLEIYSRKFQCSKEDITMEDGKISCNGENEISYGKLAIISETDYETTLKASTEYRPKSNPAVYAVSFVEVKVDKYTGLFEIEDVLAVQDAGQVINMTLAEGQVQGGAHMSLGMAMCEEVEYDKKGKLKNENFSKYHLINAPSMPEVRTLFIQKGEPNGPFGAKSVGEIAAVAPGPALMNAINDALDTNITEYPATPERIIKALSNK